MGPLLKNLLKFRIKYDLTKQINQPVTKPILMKKPNENFRRVENMKMGLFKSKLKAGMHILRI